MEWVHDGVVVFRKLVLIEKSNYIEILSLI